MPAKPAFRIWLLCDTDVHGEGLGMANVRVFGGHGTVGVRGMAVFKRLGGRGTVGGRGMTVFKVFAGKAGFPNLPALH